MPIWRLSSFLGLHFQRRNWSLIVQSIVVALLISSLFGRIFGGNFQIYLLVQLTKYFSGETKIVFNNARGILPILYNLLTLIFSIIHLIFVLTKLQTVISILRLFNSTDKLLKDIQKPARVKFLIFYALKYIDLIVTRN
jgi:hypothetical protein